MNALTLQRQIKYCFIQTFDITEEDVRNADIEVINLPPHTQDQHNYNDLDVRSRLMCSVLLNNQDILQQFRGTPVLS